MSEAAYSYSEDREDYEVINGKVYMMARPTTDHMLIEKNIVTAFQNYLKGKRCIPMNEADVFLDDDNNIVPDVMIICDPEIIKKRGIYGVPDLIVEILSPYTASRDKLNKRELYERFGVKEYWIVDPSNKSVEVYLLKDGALKLDGFYMIYPDYAWEVLTDEQKAAVVLEIKVSLYDDFYVKLEDILEDIK